jgi:hypothetical protein
LEKKERNDNFMNNFISRNDPPLEKRDTNGNFMNNFVSRNDPYVENNQLTNYTLKKKPQLDTTLLDFLRGVNNDYLQNFEITAPSQTSYPPRFQNIPQKTYMPQDPYSYSNNNPYIYAQPQEKDFKQPFQPDYYYSSMSSLKEQSTDNPYPLHHMNYDQYQNPVPINPYFQNPSFNMPVIPPNPSQYQNQFQYAYDPQTQYLPPNNPSSFNYESFTPQMPVIPGTYPSNYYTGTNKNLNDIRGNMKRGIERRKISDSESEEFKFPGLKKKIRKDYGDRERNDKKDRRYDRNRGDMKKINERNDRRDYQEKHDNYSKESN